jgi:hypothetical protein
MKLCKNVKIYGIERIIFDKTTVYDLHHKDATTHYPGVWCRTESPRNKKSDIGVISHQQMAKNINAICNTKEYDVGINGSVIHVDSRKPQYQECDCESCECYFPEIDVVCVRHGE